MSDAIKPGDLVMVVRPAACCGSDKALGMVFTAGPMHDGPGRCGNCGAISTSVDTFNETIGKWVQVYRLKKIPPLSEPEFIGVNLSLPEPACP